MQEQTVKNWNQPPLFPPSTVRVEVVAYLDGPTETVQVGWKVTDADTDEVLSMGIDRSVPIIWATHETHAVLERELEAGKALLSPF